jgi:hypothetical protein
MVLKTVGKTWGLDLDTMVEQSPLVEVTFRE